MQDWGIVIPIRPGWQSLLIIIRKRNWDERFHVFELIVASYNDAILGRLAKGQVKADFLQDVKESTPKLKVVRDYWKEIYNKENFPVGKLVI
jgi:hypothetical protein